MSLLYLPVELTVSLSEGRASISDALGSRQKSLHSSSTIGAFGVKAQLGLTIETERKCLLKIGGASLNSRLFQKACSSCKRSMRNYINDYIYSRASQFPKMGAFTVFRNRHST